MGTTKVSKSPQVFQGDYRGYLNQVFFVSERLNSKVRWADKMIGMRLLMMMLNTFELIMNLN
jgi:hypothetical protein